MPQIQEAPSPRVVGMPAGMPGASASVVVLGRILYSPIFILSAVGHFSQPMIGHAAQHGVPMPEVLVPLSGVIALAGGLSVLGYHARIGGLLLVLFLAPVTISMHNFWTVTDPQQTQIQQIMFMKNVSMLGGALLIVYFGAGPLSLDAWRKGLVPDCGAHFQTCR